MKQILTKTEFADLCGVTKQAINSQIKKSLKPALVGNKVDAAHPVAVAYASKRGDRPRGQATPIEIAPNPLDSLGGRHSFSGEMRQEEDTESIDPRDIPSDIRRLTKYTLNKLLSMFGTETRFKGWLSATKEIENIHEKRLKNETTEGSLVDRELVQHNVLNYIEEAHIKLMTDCAKTITVEVIAMHEAGDTDIDCEKYVSEQIGSFIRPMKARIAKGLRKFSQ